MWRTISVVLLLLSAASAARASDVRVGSIALYSSGVGYFEHAGTVSGDGSVELQFKAPQVNDVLKSLVLQDLDGGRVAAVTYPSQDPVGKTLKSFQVDVTANPSLAELLNQLRGARVTVDLGTEKLSGTVVGVEVRQRPVGDEGHLASLPYLNLLLGGAVRTVSLEEVRELSLEDPKLRDELAKALATLAQARDQDKKAVTIRFQGTGERRVRIGYVVETPVWKTSYRLVLPPKGEGKPKIQGWAIVENQTEGDWNDVRLSLVSGRPVSFVQDLYQPLYAPRPVVKPELFAGLRPQVYEGGLAVEREVEGFAADVPAERGRAAAKMAMSEMPAAAPAPRRVAAEDRILDATASVASVASSARMGELFQYTVDGVTLARQQSALLPIVTDDVEAERVSIYNRAVLPRNPLTGVVLENTTGKHFLQGPVTVLDGGGYGGDARIDDLPPGQERLLSYGVDLQVTVDAGKTQQEEAILTGRIVQGVLWVSRRHVVTQEYLADNKSGEDKTLIVEHAFRPGWKLVDTEKPVETTDSLHRFRGKVAAGKAAKLVVKEELVRDESFRILPWDLGQVAWYSQNGRIPAKVREALVEAARRKRALADAEREVEKRTRAVEEIAVEQQRIRENMRTVSSGSAYHDRLLAKLNEQEGRIEALQSERDELQKQRDAQQKALEEYLAGLTVE